MLSTAVGISIIKGVWFSPNTEIYVSSRELWLCIKIFHTQFDTDVGRLVIHIEL